MTYVVEHSLVNHKGRTSIRTEDGLSRAHFAHSGSLTVRFPGRLCPVSLDLVRQQPADLRRTRSAGTPSSWLSH
jgi:hypothetical protein